MGVEVVRTCDDCGKGAARDITIPVTAGGKQGRIVITAESTGGMRSLCLCSPCIVKRFMEWLPKPLGLD